MVKELSDGVLQNFERNSHLINDNGVRVLL